MNSTNFPYAAALRGLKLHIYTGATVGERTIAEKPCHEDLMPWSDNSGGRGPARGPWGQPPKGNGGNGANGGGRSEPPDLEELLQASRQRLKRAFPRGRGGRGGGGGGAAPQFSPKMAGLAAVGLLALWLLSGFYQVGASRLGVVTTFGKFDRVTSAGLHWHVPSPIQTVTVEPVTEIRALSLPETGSSSTAGIGEGLMLTKDKNILDVAMTVQWQIKNDLASADGRLPPVAQFLFNVADPGRLVTTIGEAALREVIGNNDLDFIRTEGRNKVQDETLLLMQQALDEQNTGIQIVSVNLQKTEPPTPEVNAAFLDVIAAGQNQQATINDARAYANSKVPDARGQAQRILEDARAYASRVTAEARGQADRFSSIYTEYQKAPEVTRERLYLETIERVLGPMNKVIMENDGQSGVVPYMSIDELRRRQQTQPQPSGGQQ
jgi:membrane protease subunit HflK